MLVHVNLRPAKHKSAKLMLKPRVRPDVQTHHYKCYPQVLPILSGYLSGFSRCLAEIGNDWQSDG